MTKHAILFSLAAAAAACTAKSPSSKEGKDQNPAAPASEAGDRELTLAEATDGLPKDGKLMAEIITDLGSIRCELLPDAAPKTVASFVGLARGLRPFLDPATHKWVKRPYYDGLAFHRVMPRFMIQGGDPLSTNYSHPGIGSGGPGFTLPDEIAPDLRFDHPGVMAVANTGPHTHSGGSQFFITEVPYPSLNGGYAIFGQCEDANIEQAIARVPTQGNDKPATAVTMKVKIYRK